MEVEEYIERIVDNGKVEDMHTLSNILEEVMLLLEKYDKEQYEEYEMKLYKMAYGNTLSKEMAEKIVNEMRPYGEKWSLNETMDFQERYGLENLKSSEFYAVLNMGWNDYQDIFGDNIEMYLKFARDFIEDEDAKDGKVFLYFTTIAK
jgi:predicted transcriptional regulator